MFELGMNFLASIWLWWCRATDVVKLWNPFGALFSLVLMVGLFGYCVKKIMGAE
ncbi:MAG: hypothetical protein QGG19_21390 [Alphaproteobacteria bacterium]|jgi:glucan phosphoethanolaminetransferase (alkaline phosphatase superfamily)|nr:hypothetical protein [Alphaproteobacteria bacterium]MDP7055011.1 hypothetical protein [Alphaproteobacteria bacterium]MDP7230172.1 hypothetical protein [Alphaproteobacteria bacterium]MDP7460255.1 hypothetical protein [Alphaproteobacteria bacterium]MEE1556446.1 hypothetical protein [Alphaproteobacteria bacterium]|tara:strand:+ start:10230 stop:10391 length:162 start_codon:yes stop_codon:yes gene_type:complete